MCVGNDTSHASWADFSPRNRGPSCVHSFSKKWLRHFFDRLSACPPPGQALSLSPALFLRPWKFPSPFPDRKRIFPPLE